jgi:hypothetical protein
MWMVQNDKYYDYIARSGKKIGFDLDDQWTGIKDSIAIKISYFDNNTGKLNLVYNNGKELVRKTQQLNGDSTLRTATFFVSQMKSNGLENDFDFVLEAGENTESIVVSFVRVVAANAILEPVGINQKPIYNNSEIRVIYKAEYKSILIESSNELKQINVYNSLGKKVKNVICRGKEFNLRTDGFNAGIYVVHVHDKSGNIKRDKISMM